MRLIDADALGIGRANRAAFVVPEYADGWNSAIDVIENAPTVDAVPVVRCKDCKWWCRGCCEAAYSMLTGDEIGVEYCVDGNFYCANGERRQSDG